MTANAQSEAQAAPPRRIVLTGFMGSGKTTVGPLRGRAPGLELLDVDDVIEAEAGMTIAEIFARHGEAAFREREHADHRAPRRRPTRWFWPSAAAQSRHAATRELLLAAPGTLLVHLEVELATTLKRCSGTEQTRPILADQANLASRYQRRLPLYRMAHVSIPVDALTPEQVVEAILRAARHHCP